jgi:hypothetical protein
VLIPGTVRAEVDGVEVAGDGAPGGEYHVWVPEGRVTLIANDGQRDCPPVTRDLVRGEDGIIDLLCP